MTQEIFYITPENSVILDRPMHKEYECRLTEYLYAKEKNIRILFLCSPQYYGHLVSTMRELKVVFDFLDIPKDEWDKWKQLPNYIGN
jgi:hypothetical protein